MFVTFSLRCRSTRFL
ncbi:hypothetical protein YPPY95_3020, partial [Yersinia pestis PY-95]